MTEHDSATSSATTAATATAPGLSADAAAAVAAAMDDIRAIEAGFGVTRQGVERIRDRLVELTAQRRLFSSEAFPPPGPGEKLNSCLYRLAQDDDDRFVLYANASRGGVGTPAHNHTTWAVVVGFDGQELNRFYRRTGEGVEQVGEHLVEAGTGVAMLPDDLHSIHIEGPALNFHCYGLALERLDRREYYDGRNNEWKIFPAHVDIREARSGRAA
jgi:predicted metal-dependent enzyme (double-stranded beta helix superfamily)